MITTIQLDESTKNSLSKLRNSSKETYEDVIINLIKISGMQKMKNEKLLIQECKEMREENLKVSKEWDKALMDGLDENEKWDELL